LADERRATLSHRIFYEMAGTPVGMIVDQASSDPGLPGDPPLPIDADHVGIVKPTDRGELIYVKTRQFIAPAPGSLPRTSQIQRCALPTVKSKRQHNILPKRNQLLAQVVIFFGIVFVGYVGWYFWPTPIRPPIDDMKPSNLPLSIAELREPAEARYSGLYPHFGENGPEGDNASKLDPPLIGIGDVYISNTSLTKAVTLRLFLLIKDKKGNVTKREADGHGPFLRIMGRDDFATKLIEKRGLKPDEYILSPVSIPPQKTVHGALVFVISEFGFGGDGKVDNDILEYYASGVLNKTFKYTLQIVDVVSGTIISIPVPSSGYRGTDG
jgi:hypothetical protein